MGAVLSGDADAMAAPPPESAPYAGGMEQLTVVIVLAGGAGSRFTGEGHKLSAHLDNGTGGRPRTLIDHTLTHALASKVGPVVVVTGAAGDIVPEHLADDVTVAHNDRWQEGQITSLQRGIEAARTLDATSVIVGLGDQPFISPAAWQAVATAAGPIAVATYDGQRANPVKLDADVWELLPTTGDEGARALIRVRPELVREVACSGSPTDIDTTEDLRRWQSN